MKTEDNLVCICKKKDTNAEDHNDSWQLQLYMMISSMYPL